MAFPFKITNPKDVPPGESMLLSDADIKSIKKQNEALLAIRGRALSAALLVEQKLDDLLSLIFMGLDQQARSQFKELLLAKEFFTFMNKWKVLRDLLNRKAITFEKEEERKEFLTNLHTIIETRDRFAHGDVVFSGTQPQLHFVSEGEQKYVVLEDEYFNLLNETINGVYSNLEALCEFLIKQLGEANLDHVQEDKKTDKLV